MSIRISLVALDENLSYFSLSVNRAKRCYKISNVQRRQRSTLARRHPHVVRINGCTTILFRCFYMYHL